MHGDITLFLRNGAWLVVGAPDSSRVGGWIVCYVFRIHTRFVATVGQTVLLTMLLMSTIRIQSSRREETQRLRGIGRQSAYLYQEHCSVDTSFSSVQKLKTKYWNTTTLKNVQSMAKLSNPENPVGIRVDFVKILP